MEWLNDLVRATTAFRNYTDMVWTMADGYVPTIFPRTRRQRLLRRILESNGLKVWPQI